MIVLHRTKYKRGQRVFPKLREKDCEKDPPTSRYVLSCGAWQCHTRATFSRRGYPRFTWDIQRDSAGVVRLYMVCYRCRKLNDISGHDVNEQGFTNVAGDENCIECVHCDGSNYAYLQGWDKVSDREKRALGRTRAKNPAETYT